MTTGPFQVMPDLSPAEYEKLKAEIAAHGVLVPITVDQHGRIIDGHHRQSIAEELKVPYDRLIRHFVDDEEAREFALKLNLTRRHLTREQRRALIVAELKHDDTRSNRQIARLLGVDHKTVGEVRTELGGEIPHRRLQQLLDRADYSPYVAHPFLEEALPLVPVDQFAGIVQSIRSHGLIMPIVLNHDKTVLVDGRIRFLACQAANVEPHFKVLGSHYDELKILEYIYSVNLIRTSLSQDQIAMLQVKVDKVTA